MAEQPRRGGRTATGGGDVGNECGDRHSYRARERERRGDVARSQPPQAHKQPPDCCGLAATGYRPAPPGTDSDLELVSAPRQSRAR